MTPESVIVNVTVAGMRAPGNLRAYPGGPVPNASVLTYAPGVAKANTTVVALAEDGTISLYSDSEASAHVIVDVLGYALPGSSHVGIVPTRVLDTRVTDIENRGSGFLVPVRGGVVPVDATAVVLNVTAISPPGPGHLRVWSGCPLVTDASSVNFIPGRDVSNLVVTGLRADGSVLVYAERDFLEQVDLAIDVVGYIAP